MNQAAVDAKTPAVDPAMAELAQSVLLASPVSRALGVRMCALERERVVLELPFDNGKATCGDVVHGGVIATLIDIAGAAAAASNAPAHVRGGATSALSISYLAAARGADLRAEACVLRRGRRQVVSDVSVYAGDSLVAKALLTSAMF